MSGILVGHVMTNNVITASTEDTVASVASVMATRSIGSVIIMEKMKAVGILTENDIVKLASQNKNLKTFKARDAMSTPLLTVNPNAGLEEAVKSMVRNRIKKLPVTIDGRIVGIITLTDFARLEPFVVDTLQQVISESGLPRTFEKYLKPKPTYVV